MKRSNFFGTIFLVFLLTVSHSVLAYGNNVSLNKPPIQSADDFYKNKYG
jgi:hypothetical protein